MRRELPVLGDHSGSLTGGLHRQTRISRENKPPVTEVKVFMTTVWSNAQDTWSDTILKKNVAKWSDRHPG